MQIQNYNSQLFESWLVALCYGLLILSVLFYRAGLRVLTEIWMLTTVLLYTKICTHGLT